MRRLWLTLTAGLVAVATVLTMGGCDLAKSADVADRRQLYRAVSPGFCQELPFDVFEEQLGKPRARFGTGEQYGSSESVAIVDAMSGSCDVHTTSTEPEREVWDAVFVSIHTHATVEQARAAYTAKGRVADSTPVRFTDLDGAVDRWRAYQYPLMFAGNGEHTRILEMLDRNVVASVSFDFIPARVDEQRFAAATIKFVKAMWTYLRGRTGLTQASPIAAPSRPSYKRLEHGFSPRWDISALEDVLGPRRKDRFADFRSEDSSMVGCDLHTAGPRGVAAINLHVKYFDSAEQASAFFATHFTVAAAPTPLSGTLAGIASISWQYRPPSDEHAGLYFVAVADNNVVALLQVTSRPGDNLIDDRLARPVADTLGTALTLIRAAN